MDRVVLNEQLQSLKEKALETVKQLMNTPIDDLKLKSIYEELLIFHAEIEEAIKGIEGLMDGNGLNTVRTMHILSRLANRGVKEVLVKPLIDDCTVLIYPSEGRALLIDCYKLLSPDWTKSFEEIPLDEVLSLLGKPLYVEVDGKRFQSWEELEMTMKIL